MKMNDYNDNNSDNSGRSILNELRYSKTWRVK
jgi:hypothetical protein